MKRNKFASRDFEKNLLPTNRRELFFDVLKLHYLTLLKLGLLLTIFAIPLIVCMFVKDYSYVIKAESGQDNAWFLFFLSFIEAICFMIFAIGLGGIGKIFKEFSWMEPVFFKDDFLKGVKENIKPTLIISLLAGISHIAFNYIYIFSVSPWIKAIPFGFNYAILYPVLLITFFINVIYTNKFFLNLKLGIYVYIKHLPSIILCVLLVYILLIPNFFPMMYFLGSIFKVFLFVLFMIFILPMIILGINLNMMRIFDKEFNQQNFPQLVNKGLFKETQN